MRIPDYFVRTITDLHGERGQRWLDELPALIVECATRWSLAVYAPFDNLSYNFVAPARDRSGQELVLKLGVPNPELSSEIAALHHYDGHGAVRLLAADFERGVLLMQRLRLGRMLSEVEDDDAATLITAGVMRELWRPLPETERRRFRSVAQWAQGLKRLRQAFDGGCGPFPAHLVDQAEYLFRDLLASQDAPVLLHGDLHHYNILSSGATWLAIDPKGVVGEPAYEAGALMRNPYPAVCRWPNLQQTMARRADILTDELGCDRQRILGWSLAQAVLSAWWTYEDSGRYEPTWLVLADAIAQVIRQTAT